MINLNQVRPIEILLVEDSPSDTELTVVALANGKICNHLSMVEDGVQAMAFLRRQGEYSHAPRPDLILLDWNLPRKNGREVLTEIKTDVNLQAIPVVVLTTSAAEQDIQCAYALHTNCFITKPVDYKQFLAIVQVIETFWLTIVNLPSQEQPRMQGICTCTVPQ